MNAHENDKPGREEIENALINFGISLLRHRLLSPSTSFQLQSLPVAVDNAYQALKIDCEKLSSENRVQLIFQALTEPQTVKPTLLPITELSLSALESPQTIDNLVDALQKAFESLPTGEGRFGTFGYLMSYFGSRVALGAPDHPTLSVATYWKVLAAAAFAARNDEVLLFSGDIAGLEEFMRVKTSKQAAKNMRARSFYVQMLSQVLARAILRELDLPLCNLLFEGASRFLLMLRPDNKAKLDELIVEINRRILTLHHGELAPQFAEPESFHLKEFVSTDFQKKIGELYSRSSRAGQERFKTLAKMEDPKLIDFFVPFGGETPESNDPQKSQRCAWCRVELQEGEGYTPDPLKDPDGKRRCSQCTYFGWANEQTRGLAQQLARANYLVLRDSHKWIAEKKKKVSELPLEQIEFKFSNWKSDSATNFSTWQECLECFGFEYSLPEDFDPASKGEWLALNPGWSDDMKAPPWDKLSPTSSMSLGWRWVGKATPFDPNIEDPTSEKKGDVRDTEDICQDALALDPGSNGYRGSALFGILSMDGDSMGSLFKSCNTLFQYLTLSDAVALFFEGRVNQLCDKVAQDMFKRPGTPDEAKCAYLLYAGGDDLLILSAWQVLPELALTIRNDHARYVTCGSFDEKLEVPNAPALSISAAIVLEHANFPVYELVKDTHDYLESSKHFWLGKWTSEIRRAVVSQGQSRLFKIEIAGEQFNSGCINFLGKTLPWRIFIEARELKKEINDILESDGHRSLIQRLLAIEAAFGRDWEIFKNLPDQSPPVVAEALGTFEKKPQNQTASQTVTRPNFSLSKKAGLPQEVRLVSGEWQWLAAYSLLRYAMMPQQKEKPELQKQVLRLRELLLTIQSKQLFHPLAYLGLAARWVELSTKKRSKEYGE